MKERIIEYAKRYEQENTQSKQPLGKANGKTSYPAVYILVGGGSKDWERERFCLSLTPDGTHTEKNARAMLAETFCKNEEALQVMDKQIRGLKTQIQKSDDLLLSKVNVYVIAEAHRYEAAVLKEISLLVKDILQEDFPVVCMELFALLEENNDVEDFALRQAVMMQFFIELDEMQAESFVFDKPLKMTEQKIAMPVRHKGRLFENVFLLSNRNSNGVIASSAHADENKIKMIRSVNQLKNMHSAYYNEQQFASITQSAAESAPQYSTLGLHEIVKPGYAIVITVLTYVFLRYYERATDNKQMDTPEGRELLPFAPDHTLLATLEDDLLAVLANKPTANIGLLTLKEAEAAIYGESLMRFFKLNFTDKMDAAYEKAESEIESLAQEKIKQALYMEKTLKLLNTKINEISDQMASLEQRMNQRYDEKTARYLQQTGMLGKMLFKDSRLERIKKEIAAVYLLKVELQTLQNKLNGYKKLQQLLLRNEKVQSEATRKLDDIKNEIEAVFTDALHDSEQTKFGKNIKEYYKKCVDGILNEMENAQGKNFYFDGDYIGDVNHLLEQEGALLTRILQFSESYVLSKAVFHKPFEQELADRSAATYEGYTKDGMDRTDFYKYLFETLSAQAAVCINLCTSDDQLYQEQYYIGNGDSKFMQFVKTNKSFKMKTGFAEVDGCESIRHMILCGGFPLSGLKIYESCWKHYQAYKENGYCFNTGGN